MAENRLPGGVGKKIVEALKKQAEIEIQPIPERVETNQNINADQVYPQQENFASNFGEGMNFENNMADFTLQDSDLDDINSYNEMNSSIQDLNMDNNFSNSMNFDNMETQQSMFGKEEPFHSQNNINQQQTQNMSAQTNYTMPANVSVLKRLIMQLPQGVSKQTGAMIIRQTMEALGISMQSVLKEAQHGQDSLSASAKACLATIQEYQNNIRSLEKQVQDYKKQAIALNELISLFLMTDRH